MNLRVCADKIAEEADLIARGSESDPLNLPECRILTV